MLLCLARHLTTTHIYFQHSSIPPHCKYGTGTDPVYTVEVGRLHTLRLESLKCVFQPLHKFIVNKLQFWQVG